MNRGTFLKTGLAAALGLATGALAQNNSKKSVIVEARCVGCGDCIRNCPVKAIRLRRGKAFIDQETCIGCKLCTMTCSYGAPR